MPPCSNIENLFPESPVRKSQSDSVFESSETGKSPSHSNKKRKGSSDKPVKSR